MIRLRNGVALGNALRVAYALLDLPTAEKSAF